MTSVTVDDKTFNSETVELDDRQFNLCSFINCVLIYRGGEPPAFNNCTFQRTRVQLEDAAANTGTYLAELHDSPLQPVVERVLSRIRAGTQALPQRPAPCTAVAEGTHYGRLAVIAGFLIIVTLLASLTFWYAYIQYPEAQLNDNQPIRLQVPLDVYPALPDELGEAYDVIEDRNRDDLIGFELVDEDAQVGRIPVEDAAALALQNGVFGTAGEE
jgi:hypothetical protein